MKLEDAMKVSAMFEEAEKISKQVAKQIMTSVKNPVKFTIFADPSKAIGGPSGTWRDEWREDIWQYFRLDCCSPGTDDSIEEAYFMDYVSMYHYWRESVHDDKAAAADDGDTGRDPYNYLMYYIKAEIEERYGKLYVVEHEYPVKAYKRHGKIFCKYK